MTGEDQYRDLELTGAERAALDAMSPEQRHAALNDIRRFRAATALTHNGFQETAEQLEKAIDRLRPDLDRQPDERSRECFVDFMMALSLLAESAHAMGRGDLAIGIDHLHAARRYTSMVERYTIRPFDD